MKPKLSKNNKTDHSDNSKNSQLIHQSLSIPLHHPAFLKEFAAMDKDFPARIITMTEKEQSHQHQKDNRELRMQERKLFHAIFETYLGMIIAALIALGFCYGGIKVILEGYPYVGLSILGGVIVALVSVFIQGKIKNKHESN